MKKLILFITLQFLFLLFIASNSNLLAHGFGKSLEKEVNGYLIDVGYDPEDGTAGETFVYDLSILKPESKEPVEFTDVWVRVSKDKKTYLATGIAKSRIGKTTLAFVYPIEGIYELSVRFQNGKDTLGEAKFELPVAKTTNNKNELPMWSYIVFSGFLGMVIWGIIFKIVSLKKSD